ncbi:MAG TPA: squalene/phytoene synthase family protein [Gaiellaceae bacterium]
MSRRLDQAYEDCRRLTHASGSSFYAGMRLLDAERRRALFAVYALARRIDDIADGQMSADVKLAHLDELRRELHRGDGAEEISLLVAVRDAARRYPIPLEAFDDLLDGAESDVRGQRYDTFPELEHYCRCVAGSIGRLCLGVFEPADQARAEPLADDLGVALQLGNILRDLADDLRHGRLYLPADDLDRFGCRVAAGRIDGAAELVVAFEAERALGRLARGMQLVALLDRGSARCVTAMTVAYRQLIERIADDPAVVLRRRVSLPPWRKRVLVATTLIRGAA